MRHIHSFLLACVLMAGLSPIPGVQEVQDPPMMSRAGRAASKKLLAQMQGAWRLADMQLLAEGKGGFGDRRFEHSGYCLIHDEYLSLEFHLRLVDKDDKDWGQSFVTGLHRFELDGTGSMETTTVIATNTRSDGNPEFESPGTKRRYTVEFTGERLTMTRDDGHRLDFERMIDKRQRFDIFGRPVREKDEDDSSKAGKESGSTGGERKKD